MGKVRKSGQLFNLKQDTCTVSTSNLILSTRKKQKQKQTNKKKPKKQKGEEALEEYSLLLQNKFRHLSPETPELTDSTDIDRICEFDEIWVVYGGEKVNKVPKNCSILNILP